MNAPIMATWSAQADELVHTTGRALLFLLGDTTYALSVEYVERVIELPKVVAVPRGSDWLIGMAVYESVPLALIDPRYFLQREQWSAARLEGTAGRAIVVSCAHGRVMLAVEQLVTISDLSGRKPVATSRPAFPEQFIEFACTADETVVGVVSVPRLMLAAGNMEKSLQNDSAGDWH